MSEPVSLRERARGQLRAECIDGTLGIARVKSHVAETIRRELEVPMTGAEEPGRVGEDGGQLVERLGNATLGRQALAEKHPSRQHRLVDAIAVNFFRQRQRSSRRFGQAFVIALR